MFLLVTAYIISKNFPQYIAKASADEMFILILLS